MTISPASTDLARSLSFEPQSRVVDLRKGLAIYRHACVVPVTVYQDGVVTATDSRCILTL